MGQIARNARRVENLVEELLELARLESGQMKLAISRVDLAETVAETVRAQTPLAERAGVTLDLRAPVAPVTGAFDVSKIRTVVANLISNAIKFNGSGGKVQVSLRVIEGIDGDVARIDVKDTGIGIPEDDLPRVFDRFFQTDTSSTRGFEGIGIGLALVREIVELHGGTVEAESELGVGSTFTVHLPLRTTDVFRQVPGIDLAEEEESTALVDPVQIANDVPEAQDPDIGEIGVGSPPLLKVQSSTREYETVPTVLVVEDNAEVRTFLRDHFEPGFRVVEAADGEEGLALVRENSPDLLITDIMMPKMDGIELCRAIKSDRELRRIPVILLTARAGEAETMKGLRAGADEYISKPFSVAQLVQLAANMVRSRAQLRADTRRRITVTPSEITEVSQDEALLGRVARVVENHLGDAYFTVDALADEIGLSRRQLERRMPDACGESPSEFVRRMRLERARQLLEADVGTVSEIMYASGYRSSSQFASAFRRAYGALPSKYRQSVNGGG
jgi:signal transduction histidine kinase